MTFRAHRLAFAFTAAALFANGAWADDNDKGKAGGIAFHYVGRVKLNFLDGSGIVYGYVTAMSGIGSTQSLFKGAPSEATAYLTFRANIKFTALPPNGTLPPAPFAILPVLVDPGTWSIYYTANPAHNWDDPDTFSNHQEAVVATLARPFEQFSLSPTLGINAGAATFQSTASFPLGGRMVNLRDLAPQGLVDVSTGPATPLPGSTQTLQTFAVSGYSLVSGR